MSYYDDVVEHETGGYNNINYVKKYLPIMKNY